MNVCVGPVGSIAPLVDHVIRMFGVAAIAQARCDAFGGGVACVMRFVVFFGHLRSP
jgi:hypothetical protein